MIFATNKHRVLYKIFCLFCLVFFGSLNLIGEEVPGSSSSSIDSQNLDKIDFSSPQGYTDQEFNELQKIYIEPRNLTLKKIKKMPLNEMSNEFIQKLVNLISNKVGSQLRRELTDYLNEILKSRNIEASSVVNGRKTVSKQESLDVFDRSSQEKAPDLKIKKRTTRTKKSSTHKKRSKKAVTHHHKTYTHHKAKKAVTHHHKTYTHHKARKTVTHHHKTHRVTKKTPVKKKVSKKTPVGSKSNTVKVSFGAGMFVNINTFSKDRIGISVKHTASVKHLEVSIFIHNLATKNNFLIKNYSYVSLKNSKGLKNITTYWPNPQVPYGKYKLFVVVKFLGSGSQMIQRIKQYWGSSSSKYYVIFKN